MSKLYDNSKETQSFIQKQLAFFRKRKNLTQEQVAIRINASPKTISDIETGRRGVSLKTLIKICNVLEIDIKHFFNEKKKNDQKTN